MSSYLASLLSGIVRELSLVTRVPLIAADLLVLVLTWMKTYRQYKEARSLNIKSPLATCLIHDGTTYFIILLILNVADMASFYFTSITNIISFTNTMPQILVCRLMMNLRQLDLSRSTTSEVGTSQQLASLRMSKFANNATPNFIGNMGEPLNYDRDDGEDDGVCVSDEQPAPHCGEQPEV
ncbi:uncharacterized protein PHACADRAFT_206478 [Phanerochaete carnosa HHB-10118-sp]|uniref:Uncharacterized protein n=1 Tax=Phanerochaete carnosa (strain HHB-10118-sp) TaxID=650164 RepID=K5W154_PHACS|nr:uncharacterized protein PHACADRAFT_206478 [Phanerochaete carnosa HHB-10118-sp]EKM57583.1 hypothetical protein PHACADRAFT_206478 [Phanerochaete carnosa HHB-10118-sp]